MPPFSVETPNYRVLQVVEVAPEVVTSSVDGDEFDDTTQCSGYTSQGSGSALEAFELPPPAFEFELPPPAAPPSPENPRIMAMLRAPIPRREYRFTGDYIYVDYERFMRSVDPNWIPPPWVANQGTAQDIDLDAVQEAAQESSRQPSSCLYTSTNNRQGPVSCSERMSKWLDELPDPKQNIDAAQSSSSKPQDNQPLGGAEDLRPHNEMLPGPSRPRAQSMPVPFSISNNHLMGDREHRPGQSNPGMPTSRPVAGPGPAIPSPHHPNPLGQHPIVRQELPIQLRIPKRKSSLYNNFQSSHANHQPPAPLTTPAADDLIRGINSIQLDNPTQFKENQLDTERQDSAPDLQLNTQVGLFRRNTFACPQLLSRLRGRQNSPPHPRLRSQLDPQLRASSHRPRIDPELDQDTFLGDNPPQFYNNANEVYDPTSHRRFSAHVHQLFGHDSGKVNHKKHPRSETPVTMESQRPIKRIRGAIDTARNRLSMRGMPAAVDDFNDGRQSRLGRMASTAAKRMSLPILAGRSIVKVPPFSSFVKYERITIGFIGDKGCGKTSLVQRYSTGSHDTENPARVYKDGYAIETFYIEVDGDPVRMELCDVSSECNFLTAQDHCRPLTTANYDLMIICFDVSNDATLKSAATKWQSKVELYCGSPDTMLVGLKQDLRKARPTLGLLHLGETQVTAIAEGEEKAKEMDAKAYYECSAVTGEGATDVIHGAIRIALERRRRANPPTKVRKFLNKVKQAKKEFKMFRN